MISAWLDAVGSNVTLRSRSTDPERMNASCAVGDLPTVIDDFTIRWTFQVHDSCRLDNSPLEIYVSCSSHGSVVAPPRAA